MCNETKKPHKHAELIKAWADGAKIQVKTTTGQWTDCRDALGPWWRPMGEYRIKPEPIKTRGYRRYVWKDHTGEIKVNTLIASTYYYAPEELEKKVTFIKWIDTEWQYHEIDL